MTECMYTGPFKEHLQNHVELKQAIGYKYVTEANHLKRFDRFTFEKYPEATSLTKEIVLDWCNKKTYEAQANQCSRASILRAFSKYLDNLGINAYVLPKGYYPSEQKYIPYIYTPDELTKFFEQTDKCNYCCECPNRHHIMPVIFRMIYMCGLRASEARLLKVADVDCEQGTLIIHQSKKDNSRMIVMSGCLTERCRTLSATVHGCSVSDDYYFPALNEKPITLVNLYNNFRRFLWRARISHRGKGHGPRIHDFRHTYAVHCLKKWVEQEKDLMTYLPILKTYMGHDSFAETAYYLRLTADVFPTMMLKIELHYSAIIPELGGYDETN